MIQTVIFTLIGAIMAYVAYIILKPLTELALLKFKHGKDIHINFFPILGQIFIEKMAFSKYHDINY